jgi:NAD(P)-dependent dehydrogenase (short-subunit alcohol dehydrogenase family)
LKLAVITGGSRGLGAALIELYRAEGWQVMEFSRTAPHAFSTHSDMSQPADSAQVFATAFKSLDQTEFTEIVAFNNAAALGPVGSVETASPTQIARHFDINVVSAVLFARAFISVFQNRSCEKSFVNITSGAAVRPYAGWSLYSASKAALENFVRSMAMEQEPRPHPIRAISVNPGVMDTAMQAEVRDSSVDDFPARERFVRLQSDDRLQAPSRVARQIAELVRSRPEAGGVYSVGA